MASSDSCHRLPLGGAAYASSGFGDELVSHRPHSPLLGLTAHPPVQALGALALALATNSSAYYLEAYNHYRTYSLAQDESYVLNWDDKTPAVFELLVEVALARPNLAEAATLNQNVTGWKGQMEGYLDKIVDGTSRGYLTKGTRLGKMAVQLLTIPRRWPVVL